MFYLCKSTIWLSVEYCCDMCAGTVRCYLYVLDKLHEWLCWAVTATLAASHELLAYPENVAGLSMSYK